MRKEIYKLGNSENGQNDIRINDSRVSFDHLEIEYIDKDHLLIRDLNSRNGTKVNDRKIIQTTISANDKIEVGFNKLTGSWIISEVRKLRPEIIFYEEFSELEVKYKIISTQKKQLKAAYNTKLTILRFSIPVGLILLFLGFGEEFGIPKDMRLIVPMIGGTIGSLMADKLYSRDALNEKLRQLDEEYEQIIVCPKCRTSLFHKTFQYWKNKRRCHICQANWVE